MNDRFKRRFLFFVLFLLVLTIFTTHKTTAVFAETYAVPQTAELTLAWDPVEPVPDGYHLYQRKEGQSYDYSDPCWTGTATTGTVYNLDWDATYYFVVRAYVGDQESANSNEVTFLSGPPTTSSFTISVIVGDNGTVSPADSVTVASGADQTFTITPNNGYHVSDVKVDGVSVGSVLSYTFTQVSADHTLEAVFGANSYTITASADPNGAIDPAGTISASYGTAATFQITPATGYKIEDVVVDGGSVGSVSTYTFDPISENHTIHARFANSTHMITASSTGSGTILPAGTIAVNHGTSASYSITPEPGHHVADVLVDGVSVGSVSSYRFDQVVAGHTLHAVFEANTVTITSTAGTNGSISPSGSMSLQSGETQPFTITPNEGYVISDVVVDGVSAGTMDTYIFSDVSEGHTIDAYFALENQPPAADAGPDQTVDEGQTAKLSGLNSIDPDDGIASYQWRQMQGIQVTLNTPNAPETTFTTPNVDSSGAALVFELTVTDYSGNSVTDTCIVNVTWVNLTPNADAGVDQTVNENSQVVLDASHSTDLDDGIVSYAWKQVRGTTVVLSDENSFSPAFISPDVGVEDASLAFEVTVTDAGGLQDTDTCVVNVTWVNTPPVADAGPDQDVAETAEVFLDGSKSTDDDDLTITGYRWSQTSGAPVALSDTTAADPMFIVPTGAAQGGPLTFELTVTDSGGLQGVDNCQINVQPIGPSFHVSGTTMGLKQKGNTVEANAYVSIVDDYGTIVKGSAVTGSWTYNGSPMNTATADTRGDGVARLYVSQTGAVPGSVFTIEILGVAKEGYTYDSSLNQIQQDSLVVK